MRNITEDQGGSSADLTAAAILVMAALVAASGILTANGIHLASLPEAQDRTQDVAICLIGGLLAFGTFAYGFWTIFRRKKSTKG